jgi:hypothetical protein
MTATRVSHHSVFADYSQFYLCDPDHLEDWSDRWNDQSMDDRLIAMTTTIVFGTDRNFTVPVDLYRRNASPDIGVLTASADHAVIASIVCRSGKFKLAGCTDYLPDAFGFATAAGTYGVLYTAHKLATVAGLDGDDRYDVHLWPADLFLPMRVLRRHPPR